MGNSRQIFTPKQRLKDIIELFENKDFAKKFIRAMSELRANRRADDHKFKSVNFDLWITDIGGRKCGRGIYFENSNKIILWGASKDHSIEDDAKKYFGQCSQNEFESLKNEIVNITYKFPTEEEEREANERPKIFAENISDSALYKLGFNEYQIEAIRKSNTVTLWDIKSITPEMKFNVLTFLKYPKGTLLQAKDDTHFIKFIKGDISRLMIHLDKTQNQLVEERLESNMLIKGETGSGKTTILIYKAVYTAEKNPNKEYILFTYNIALANLISESVAELSGKTIDNLAIYGYYEWLKLIFSEMNINLTIIEDSNKLKIEDILKEFFSDKESKLLNLKDKKIVSRFLKEEIEKVILDLDIKNKFDYLTAIRRGRVKQLGKLQRQFVWRVYESYREYLKRENLTSYKLLPKILLTTIKSDDFIFKKDGIFVDEVQDMSPIALKSIVALRRNKESHVVFAGDYKQAIYNNAFRWSDIQLPYCGKNVKQLKKNYRNSKEILEASHNFLKRFFPDTEKPEHSGRTGSPVEFYYYKKKERVKKLIGIIEHFNKSEDISYSDIAIFTPKSPFSLQKSLTELNIPCEILRTTEKPLKNNSVKLSTLQSSKGLEFRIVIILGIQNQLMPHFKKDTEIEVIKKSLDEKAKLLYVGMTRAYNYLAFLLHADNKSNPILNELADVLNKSEELTENEINTDLKNTAFEFWKSSIN